MSEYSKLRENRINRGRPKHSPEQKAESQMRNSVRQEARRRAHMVLKARHAEEFNAIYEAEMKDLVKELSTAQKNAPKKSAKN
jgi:hypothetical protein